MKSVVYVMYGFMQGLFDRYHVDGETRDIITIACEKSKMLLFDYVTVCNILYEYWRTNTIIADDRLALAKMVSIKYHDSGKIAGTFSVDSSAHGCAFCTAMRNKAGNEIVSNDYDINQEKPRTICLYCYDYKQEKYRCFVTARHFLNMVILSSVMFTDNDIRAMCIPVTGILRINSSGDIQNTTHAINVIRIAAVYPGLTVGLWSKNIFCVNAAFDRIGKPANIRFIQSVCAINGKPAFVSEYADNTFTVYDKGNITAALENSSECNGKKCSECGYKCYFGTHDHFNIAELLR